jgi:hypothetical protein
VKYAGSPEVGNINLTSSIQHSDDNNFKIHGDEKNRTMQWRRNKEPIAFEDAQRKREWDKAMKEEYDSIQEIKLGNLYNCLKGKVLYNSHFEERFVEL